MQREICLFNESYHLKPIITPLDPSYVEDNIYYKLL